MSLILNIIWLILGGFISAVSWMFAGVLLFLTIIGIPWARATFSIGVLTLWPFGSKVKRRTRTSSLDLGTGFLGFVGNVIWFVLAGWWLFLYHIACALLFAITIIGIPFALQYFKLARLSLAPIGKEITLNN